jgi:hypothetical protein
MKSVLYKVIPVDEETLPFGAAGHPRLEITYVLSFLFPHWDLDQRRTIGATA